MTLEDMLAMLRKQWGFVDLIGFSSGKWRCADSTDEGLGPGKYEFMGHTARDAIEKAYSALGGRSERI